MVSAKLNQAKEPETSSPGSPMKVRALAPWFGGDRHQQLLNAVSGKAEEMAIALASQPADVLTRELTEFFDGIKGDLCYVPDELRLDEKAKVLMLELMELIGGAESSGEVEKGRSGETDAAVAAGKVE